MNEMSFFLVRLLQKFRHFELAPEAQPEGSRPPLHWKEGEGRKAVEEVWPGTALTLYSKVSALSGLEVDLADNSSRTISKGGVWIKAIRADEPKTGESL